MECILDKLKYCLKKIYSMSMSALPVCMSVHCMHVWCLEKSEEALDPLELEIKMAVSGHVVLETVPGSFARATSAPNHRVISPAPPNIFEMLIMLHILGLGTNNEIFKLHLISHDTKIDKSCL